MCWLEYCERSSTFSAARLENPTEVGVGFFSFDDSNCAVLASLEPEFGCSKTCLRICIEPCFWNVRVLIKSFGGVKQKVPPKKRKLNLIG